MSISRNSRGFLIALTAFVVAWPALLWLVLPYLPAAGTLTEFKSQGTGDSPSPRRFTPRPLDKDPQTPAWTTNVQIVRVNDDDRPDILVCDARFNRVLACLQGPSGELTPTVLAEDLAAPAHAEVVDFDQDGDRDILVAVLGSVQPDDTVIGRVVLLEQTASGYTPHVLLSDVRRVADVQPGDLDGDGDLDLAVAVFGYARGEILWLENHGDLRMEPHQLLVAAGTIHVPLADYDEDGDLDIAACVSQDDEAVWGFENDGRGHFTPRRLWSSLNFDLGSAGLVRADLDGDGDEDLILPVGDNLEDGYSYPQFYHGCYWLENQGKWRFEAERIAMLGGTYAAAVGDLDGDGDLDVTLVSMFNDWDKPGHSSLVWLENDGFQRFRTWQIAERPTHLVTVACGDLDGDGDDDLVTGALNVVPPFAPSPPAILWTNETDLRTLPAVTGGQP